VYFSKKDEEIKLSSQILTSTQSMCHCILIVLLFPNAFFHPGCKDAVEISNLIIFQIEEFHELFSFVNWKLNKDMSDYVTNLKPLHCVSDQTSNLLLIIREYMIEYINLCAGTTRLQHMLQT
jgi:hypothetical protein